MNRKEIEIVRELAKQVAELAAKPEMQARKKLWIDNNGLRYTRPPVNIEQVCWVEMNVDDEMTLHCEDPILRNFEDRLRRIIYKEKHFPVDYVIDPEFKIPRALTGTGFGLGVVEKTLATDPQGKVLSHVYSDQLQTEEDLEKLSFPDVKVDDAANRPVFEAAEEAFSGIMPVLPVGSEAWVKTWDYISTWRGVTNALYDMADRPEFIHKLVRRITDITTAYLDQLEERGLLNGHQTYVHCTGAYTDELPKSTDGKTRCGDMWMAGLAQMLSSVSPAMEDEFEVSYISPICARFGLVYYGCCEPLDGKLNVITKIPNLRKVSMSPWVNPQRGAEGLGSKYVYSCKPNPALLAWDSFDPGAVRKELTDIKKACEEHKTPLEFILKDVSTVRYQPQRLWQWAEIAMEVANS